MFPHSRACRADGTPSRSFFQDSRPSHVHVKLGHRRKTLASNSHISTLCFDTHFSFCSSFSCNHDARVRAHDSRSRERLVCSVRRRTSLQSSTALQNQESSPPPSSTEPLFVPSNRRWSAFPLPMSSAAAWHTPVPGLQSLSPRLWHRCPPFCL